MLFAYLAERPNLQMHALRSTTAVALDHAAFILHFLAFSMLVCGWADSTMMMMSGRSLQPTAVGRPTIFYHIGGAFVADLKLKILDQAPLFSSPPRALLTDKYGSHAVEALLASVLPELRGATELDPEGVPALFVDERAIKQVLLNLLFNAVKFTPGGGHVTLKATHTNGVHVLEVADSGDGIEPEDLKKITEPFAQLQSNPHIAKMGTGLGLAIAKALVEAHGGTLRISSVVGKGTTVRVILPSEQNAAAE